MGDGVQCLRQQVRYVLQRVDLGHGMMTLHLTFAYATRRGAAAVADAGLLPEGPAQGSWCKFCSCLFCSKIINFAAKEFSAALILQGQGGGSDRWGGGVGWDRYTVVR